MQIIHRPDMLPGHPDPFHADEPDPLRTGALESSLWELAVRHRRYHLTVVSYKSLQSECVLAGEDSLGAIY